MGCLAEVMTFQKSHKYFIGKGRLLETRGKPLASLIYLDALSDQILAILGYSVSKPQLGAADLLVALEGDVTADHVKEEDAQGPDSGRPPLVAALANPLWRRVNTRS